MKLSTAVSSLLLLLLFALAAIMSAATHHRNQEQASNYLIMVQDPPKGTDCSSYQLGVLTDVLGSKEKAKEAILYNYKNVVSGFSVRLTPSELETLKKHPAVTRVLPSATFHIMNTYDGLIG